MERYLYTRTSMTGWMFFLAFLAAFLPGHCIPNMLRGWPEGGLGMVAAVAVAALGAPFVGFIVGGIMNRFLMWTRWHASFEDSRVEIRAGIMAADWLADNEHAALMAMSDDDAFEYFWCRYGPSRLIDWVRRRRAVEFIGWDWCLAALIGVGLGWVADCPGPVTWPKVGLSVLSLGIAVVMFINGRAAKREAENAELLWVRRFLNAMPDDADKEHIA
jgi:hypothetical protein